jgi:hydrogenase nickel incorporation protein HypB
VKAEQPTRLLELGTKLLARNDRLAAHNREHFRSAGVTVLNLMSSPGAGKTSLLEQTLKRLEADLSMAVIVGDLATDNDARRLAGTRADVVQIETGALCHLESDLVHRACHDLDLAALDLLLIENVGNLVCPAAYDLGEDLRVVLLSTTEGEDKPLKYPTAFSAADWVVITKIDLAEVLGFDREAAIASIRRINPRARILEVSSRQDEAGLAPWLTALRELAATQSAVESA